MIMVVYINNDRKNSYRKRILLVDILIFLGLITHTQTQKREL